MTTLHARDLSVAFDGVHALDGIDIDVESGQVLAAIGANGAGKSTLLNVLSGLTVPDRGEVWVDGTRLESRPSVFADAGVRRSYQHLRLVDRLSIDENIALGLCGSLPRLLGIPLSRRRATREAVATARREVGIDDLRDRPVGQLSYGQRKRVELARVLVSAPRVALLDEPLAGVQAVDRGALSNAIRALASRGSAVIIVEHDLTVVAELADRALVLDAGHIARSGRTCDVLR